MLDWDVRNGGRGDLLRSRRRAEISLHQENNYPVESGALADRGRGRARVITLTALHGRRPTAYLHAIDRVVIPALEAFAPDMIIVACGYDAAIIDPLARMQATAEISAR